MLKSILRILLFTTLSLGLVGFSGCDKLTKKKKKADKKPKKVKKPEPKRITLKSKLGKTLQVGHFLVTVNKIELGYPVLTSDEGQRFLRRPAVMVRVTVKNTSAKALRYKPLHQKTAYKIDVPRLFKADGEEIARMGLSEKLRVIGRQLNRNLIDAGKSTTDLYLYSAKNVTGTELIWKAPGEVFSGTTNLQVSLPKLSGTAQLPATLPGDQPITIGKFKIEFGKAEIKYVKLFRESEEENAKKKKNKKKILKGWSRRPALVVPVTYHNLTDKDVLFKPVYDRPSTKDVSIWLPSGKRLTSTSVFLAQAINKINTKVTIKANGKAQDLFLFGIPPKETTSLILHLGKGSFGKEGVLRVTFPFSYKLPNQPKKPPR